MRELGWPDDAWPQLWPLFDAADIVVIGTPLWLGEESSVCRRVIERLYAMSGERFGHHDPVRSIPSEDS